MSYYLFIGISISILGFLSKLLPRYKKILCVIILITITIFFWFKREFLQVIIIIILGIYNTVNSKNFLYCLQNSLSRNWFYYVYKTYDNDGFPTFIYFLYEFDNQSIVL